MSDNLSDAAAYYFEYKSAVYNNLFVGIVYGEQALTYWLLCFYLFSTLTFAGVYIILYVASVHILL